MLKRNNIVVVTGVSGCGKDYLLGKALAMTGAPTPPRALSFGTLLFERLQAERVIDGGRDQLRHADASRVRAAARAIIKETVQKPGATVINTHIAYKSGGSLVVNPDMDRIIMPRHYIFVGADPAQIQGWRTGDASRKREEEGVDAIALHQAIALGVVGAIAHHLGIALEVITNTSDNVEENVDRMREILS